MSNYFITFEGTEGSGKSTQAKMLHNYLQEKSYDSILTREPGGTEGAEAIRDILVNGNADKWSSMTEALLVYAARNDHWEKLIKPSLDNGKWVICDRFFDSTIAYQGYGGGLRLNFLEDLYSNTIGLRKPDVTFFIEIDFKIGLERALSRAKIKSSKVKERFEAMGENFHKKVYDAFLDIAKNNPDRFVIIKADNMTEYEIHKKIIKYLYDNKKLTRLSV